MLYKKSTLKVVANIKVNITMKSVAMVAALDIVSKIKVPVTTID